MRSPLYLIGDAASRRGLSRVGYFIPFNGPLNGHPPSYNYSRNNPGIRCIVNDEMFLLGLLLIVLIENLVARVASLSVTDENRTKLCPMRDVPAFQTR